MSQAIHVDTKELPLHLRGITGRKSVKLHATTEVHIPAYAGVWDGGTRYQYDALELATGRMASVTDAWSPPWFSCRKDKNIHLKPGFAIVESCCFCGKYMDPTVYVHPDNAAPLLPAPGPTLSADELQVLDVTCGLKSFARADELRRRGISTERFALAKRSLIALGYLNAQGAITTKGKNARPQR
jgi:hypothetical protein